MCCPILSTCGNLRSGRLRNSSSSSTLVIDSEPDSYSVASVSSSQLLGTKKLSPSSESVASDSRLRGLRLLLSLPNDTPLRTDPCDSPVGPFLAVDVVLLDGACLAPRRSFSFFVSRLLVDICLQKKEVSLLAQCCSVEFWLLGL